MKHLKYALIALAPIALIVGLALFMRQRGGPDMPSSGKFVDVRTGEITTLKLGSDRAKGLPALADDGERMLLPVTRAEDGGWMIPAHYQPIFSSFFADRSDLMINPDTFKVIED